jgi:hypothetical protein
MFLLRIYLAKTFGAVPTTVASPHLPHPEFFACTLDVLAHPVTGVATKI